MQNARLDEAQAGIKNDRRNINNLGYADDTTLMAESKEALKNFLMKVKEESEKAGLKLNIQKTKIKASITITSWQIDGETMEIMTDFIFLRSKITAHGEFSHEIKRYLLLGRKAMTNLSDQIRSVTQSCPTLCNPMDYSLPSFSVHGIFQARILEWVTISFSRGSSDQIRSVTQSCPTLCDSMNRSTPGLPVHHQLLEFTQTHVHRVSDAIQPSHPLSSPSPLAPNPSQHQSPFQ